MSLEVVVSLGAEFVVAEMTLSKPINRDKVFADDLCLLHSSSNVGGDDDQRLGGGAATWESTRVEFLSTDDADLFQISCWHTDTVIPFDKWMCWVDYHRARHPLL
jgi:hypothetical protein